MAGSLGFRRQYCIPKGKASAGYRFADHSRSGGKALCRAERWKRGLVRSEPSCSRRWRYKSRRMDLTLQSRPCGRLWQHQMRFTHHPRQSSGWRLRVRHRRRGPHMVALPRFEPSCSVYGANAFWNSFGGASAMTLTLAILPGRLAPSVLTVTASPSGRSRLLVRPTI
jgi:hypothetical protein